MDTANIVAGIVFGTIGFAAFIYGKKQALMRPMLLGVILMAYPYFVSNVWLLYLIGIALSAGLYVWRE